MRLNNFLRIISIFFLLRLILCEQLTVFQGQRLTIEGTHRVRTHAVLLLILTKTLIFDLLTQNHITCHFLYQVWTLCDHSFLSYAADKQTDRQLKASNVLPSRHSRRGQLNTYLQRTGRQCAAMKWSISAGWFALLVVIELLSYGTCNRCCSGRRDLSTTQQSAPSWVNADDVRAERDDVWWRKTAAAAAAAASVSRHRLVDTVTVSIRPVIHQTPWFRLCLSLSVRVCPSLCPCSRAEVKAQRVDVMSRHLTEARLSPGSAETAVSESGRCLVTEQAADAINDQYVRCVSTDTFSCRHNNRACDNSVISLSLYLNSSHLASTNRLTNSGIHTWAMIVLTVFLILSSYINSSCSRPTSLLIIFIHAIW